MDNKTKKKMKEQKFSLISSMTITLRDKHGRIKSQETVTDEPVSFLSVLSGVKEK